MGVTPSEDVAVEFLVARGKDDAEAVGRHSTRQALGERAKEHVAMQVVTDGASDIEQGLGLDMGAPQLGMRFAKLFIRLLALQFGAAARGENAQAIDIGLGRLHRLGMQYSEMAQRTA